MLFRRGFYLLFDDELLKMAVEPEPVAPPTTQFRERGIGRGVKQGIARGV